MQRRGHGSPRFARVDDDVDDGAGRGAPMTALDPAHDDVAENRSHVALRRLSPNRLVEYLVPALVFIVALAVWEAWVRLRGIPPYILPAPSLIAQALVKDWGILSGSLIVTLRTTLLALGLAVAGSRKSRVSEFFVRTFVRKDPTS